MNVHLTFYHFTRGQGSCCEHTGAVTMALGGPPPGDGAVHQGAEFCAFFLPERSDGVHFREKGGPSGWQDTGKIIQLDLFNEHLALPRGCFRNKGISLLRAQPASAWDILGQKREKYSVPRSFSQTSQGLPFLFRRLTSPVRGFFDRSLFSAHPPSTI